MSTYAQPSALSTGRIVCFETGTTYACTICQMLALATSSRLNPAKNTYDRMLWCYGPLQGFYGANEVSFELCGCDTLCVLLG